ncbi:KAP family P-loop NTPase fold protein [Nocardia tengchongensis]|uniref:KAP family P-loop NTPase fold protein n=1 Tax=Nocardia tengchongensis TaxID=2055889 RepID=UPI003620E2A5
MLAPDPATTYTDSPISDPAQDRLRRTEFAIQLARRIEAASGGPSVVFGLAGPWGSGKSSVLKLVERQIQNGSQTWQVRWFTPWAASDTDSVLFDFYATIKSALPVTLWEKTKKFLSPTFSVAATAAKTIPVAGDAASTGLQLFGDLLDSTDSFNEQFRKFSEALAKENVRVLVIVDDLDRLDANELLTVLKAVRLLGSFPGIHYLLAYDHSTISDVLSTTSVAGGKPQRAFEYIEKIVQYPFELPPLQMFHRYRELEVAISEVARRSGIDVESLTVDNLPVVQAFLDEVPESDLVTLRSIHRLVHQFDVTLTIVGPDNVNFLDLLLLTFLRVSYPALYRRLPAWRVDLTRPVHHVIFTNTERQQVDWATRFANVLPDTSTEDTRTQLLALLRFLFPVMADASSPFSDDSRHLDHRRVCERDYFDRYFAFGVTVGDISDTAVLDGLTQLARGESLPADNEFRSALGDYRSRRALKIAHMVVNRAGFTAETALAGALWLTAELGLSSDRSPVNTPPARLVGDLLAIGIERAFDDDMARSIIDKYNDEFELPLTTMVIGSIEDGIESWARGECDRARRAAALANHRERQYQACVRDLDEDLPAGIGGILFHIRLMDSETRTRLGEFAQRAVNTWSDLIAIAGRFTGVLLSDDGARLGQFYFDDFAELIDPSLWPSRDHDFDITAQIDRRDVSLDNRIRVAETVLARALAEHTPQA